MFAVISQPAKKLEGLQKDLGDAITVLADPKAVAIERFGMLDPRPFPPGMRLARSGIYYIDPKGIARRRWLVDNYRDATDPSEILAALR